MKLKSLFLATLAAMAMVSCSNDNDPIENGGNKEAEKTALLDLGFAFPKATATRANGDKDAGIEDEYEFTKVAIIIDYAANGETAAKRVVEMLDRDQFSPATATADESKVVIYTKQAIPVEEGTATINAIVNPNKTDTELKEATLADLTLTYETKTYNMNILTGDGGPAAKKNFMMTNKTAISQTFEKGKTATVQIPVDRVVAKLAENTQNRIFTKQQDETAIQTGLTTVDAIKSIEVVKATYVNLATSSDVFPATADPAEFWQKYNPAETTLPATSDAGYNFVLLNGSNVNYCFENSTTTPTGIIYQAKVIWNQEEEAKTFYIAAGKLYMSYQALKEAFQTDCPEETATPAEFAAAHIRQYKNGECYYYKPIQTNGTSEKIVRNNLYKMTVSGIVKIGSSTPIPDGEETLMNLSIEVQPWTVNENAFVLE